MNEQTKAKRKELNNLIEKLNKELTGVKGKRKVKTIVSNRLENAGFKYSINVNDNYHCFYVVIEEETGGSSDLFITYTKNGTVKNIHS